MAQKTGTLTLQLSNDDIKGGDWFIGTVDGVHGIYQAPNDEEGKAATLFDAVKITTDLSKVERLKLIK